MKVLHIVASPRGEDSGSSEIGLRFLEAFRKKHPDAEVEEINLFEEKLPELGVKRVDGKYMLLEGKHLFGPVKEAWEEILQRIRQFLSGDLYLFTVPMWNFHVPYPLKHYIDVIVQPEYLFRFVNSGTEGLVLGKKAVVVATRGAEYTSEEKKKFDFQEPYLRTLLGFIGITDVTFIKAELTDGPPEVGTRTIEQAKQTATRLGGEL